MHHVTVRGVEQRTIYLDDSDRTDFLRRLERLVGELDFECIAWALLSNHFHLLVRRARAPLSVLMARLNGAYAQSFNQRHERVGHLFQDRFRSRIIEDDADFLNVTRYVLFNPVRHRVVRARELRGYPWCAFSALDGARAPLPFERVSSTLELFGRDPASARRQLRADLEEAQQRARSRSVDAIVGEECARLRVDPTELRSKRPSALVARAAICARLARELRLHPAEIAATLGLSPKSVQRSRNRARGSNRPEGV